MDNHSSGFYRLFTPEYLLNKDESLHERFMSTRDKYKQNAYYIWSIHAYEIIPDKTDFVQTSKEEP